LRGFFWREAILRAFAAAFGVDPRYLSQVPSLSRELFDTLEFDAAASGDHEAAAREMTRLATIGTETAAMPRAEAFLRTGDQWLLADDPAEAADWFRRALADGGPVFVDPRVGLARAMFLLGRATEAQALISGVKAEGPTNPRTCDLVAELLVDRGDLAGALDWATAGVELCLAGGHKPTSQDGESELRLLLRLRFRIRNDLGMPEDRYDGMLDES
jgi:hypothetical protein